MEFKGSTCFGVQMSGCLTASAKHCFHPSSQMSFSCGCKYVRCLALERNAVADEGVWCLHLVSSAVVTVMWNAAPKVEGQSVLLQNYAAGGGQGIPWANDTVSSVHSNWAEREGSWETAPYHRAVALQVHSSYLVVWSNIFDTEQIRIYLHKMIQESGGLSSDHILEGSWWFIP